ncbi:MAG: hypothetical protein P1V13_21270 [Rhizobiaceae bacterium]|nr:hypothetical protein [Rhizobiaceae bacterium]
MYFWYYIHRHWRGEQSLFLSFWINFAGLRLLIWFAPLPHNLHNLIPSNPLPLAMALSLMAADLLVFIWQTVGLLRCGEKHVVNQGGMALVWGSYAAIIVAVFAVGTQWIGLYQLTLQPAQTELFTTRMDRLHASQYTLAISDDRRIMHFNGTISLGSSKALQRMLDNNPNVAQLLLQSDGGNIYEARGMAAIIMQRQLNTRAEQECSSACTIVFMAGLKRTLGQRGKLGFHGYRLDTNTFIPNVDIAEEQEKDRQYFLARQISDPFVDRIYNEAYSSIWYPDRTQLIDAGIIGPL